MSTVTIKDIGPIKELEWNIPDDFRGVVLVKGGQGTGKSTMLNACRAVLGRKVRLSPREIVAEGEAVAKTGKVSIGDRSLTVGAKTTSKGEVEFSTIEDRFEIEDLINPRGETPEVRNATRIKALIGVTGVKPDITVFYDVVGGKAAMDTLLTPKEQETPDLVDLAGKIKRAIEKQATAEEVKLESAESNARSAAAAAEGIDVSQPSDATELMSKLTAAANTLATLTEQRTAAENARDRAKAAEAKIAEHEAGAGVTVEAAQKAVDEAAAANVAAHKRVQELKAQLANAESEARSAIAAHSSAEQVLRSVKSEWDALSGWRDEIAKAKALVCPAAAAIADAEKAKADAEAAVNAGALVRRAKDKLAEAEGFREQAEQYRTAATALRERAQSVFQVLSQQIPEGPLYVAGDRLVLDTTDREAEPFDQLSDGERSKIAAQYAVDAVGSGGLVGLPQIFWDGLSLSSKKWLAEYASEKDAIVFTGEVADGELRIEPFGAEAEEAKPARKRAK